MFSLKSRAIRESAIEASTFVTKPDIQKWFNLNPYCYLRVRASTNFNSSLSTCNSKVIHFLRIKINAPTEHAISAGQAGTLTISY